MNQWEDSGDPHPNGWVFYDRKRDHYAISIPDFPKAIVDELPFLAQKKPGYFNASLDKYSGGHSYDALVGFQFNQRSVWTYSTEYMTVQKELPLTHEGGRVASREYDFWDAFSKVYGVQ